MKAAKTSIKNHSLIHTSLLALCLFSAQNASAGGRCHLFDTNVTGLQVSCGLGVPNSTGNNSVAFGSISNAGLRGSALGFQALATGTSSVAVGFKAKSIGLNSTALGANSSSDGLGSTALGFGSNSSAFNSTSVGANSSSKGGFSVALGFGSRSTGFRSMALGYKAEIGTGSSHAIAIGGDKNNDGTGAQALAVGAIALGSDVVNNVPNSMKIAVPLRIEANAAELLIKETSSVTAVRNLLSLENNGAVGFSLEDTNEEGSWDFRTGTGGSFLIANLGTAGPEVFVSKTGLVKMGPNVQNFTLAAAGNLTIPNGSVTATNFVTSSSRSVKTDFTKVDPAMVMDKLKLLDVSGWRYKDEDVKGRHIGPIAEDFYKLFELGPDNKHISATDMASIAIVAAKELQHKVDAETAKLKSENEALKKQLEEKTMALETKNNKLQKRLASLEKLVTNLAVANGRLNSSGTEIALK